MYSPNIGGKGIGPMTPVQLDRLFQLLGSLREGVISEAEFAELNRILETDSEGQDYYVDYMYLCADLCNLQAAIRHNDSAWNAMGSDKSKGLHTDDTPLSLEAFQILGDYEKKADAVEIPKTEQDDAAAGVSDKSTEKISRRISKPLFAMLITTTAALIFLLVYINLYPRTSQEVATLTDSIDAQWTSWLPLSQNTRITASHDLIRLQRGVIKLVTDENVQVLIESPAEFRFVSTSQIVMNQGRLFATVSQTGRGFTVQTTNSKVTDLGTEFGILADDHGTTELHVLKGKTVFIGETKNKVKHVLEALGGQALRLEQQSDSVKNIELNDNAFVRSIDSKTNLLWRGQKQINLADIVGKGDGFGNGKVNIGIDPKTGKFGENKIAIRTIPNTYTAVPDSIFVDGVFVPNGKSQQVVSSAGHVFAECPPTHGCFYSPILNTPSQFGKDLSLFLGETNYSLPQNPCIFMHSNLGVTFNLNALRNRLPGAKITQFQSQVGVSNTAPGLFNVDIWVLIDGQVRCKKTGVTQRGLLDSLKIDIREQDSFLTLMATEGKNTEDNVDYARSSIGCDWVIFGTPILKLE
jgi:cell division protein FtsL